MRISDWSSDVCSSDLVIFGYCVGNDVSVRDWQTRTQQFVIGKSFDTHAPFGPWIEAADGVDAGDLDLRLLVNGEERQHSNTRDMIFDCAAQVADLPTAMTLEPGDVIFTDIGKASWRERGGRTGSVLGAQG